MSQKYESPAAFKQALEHRLKAATPVGVPVARTRQLAVFDRFLARIAVAFGDAATLKGGVALELRLERARTTKDIDLRIMGTPDGLLERLQSAGRLDLGDFLFFELEPDPHQPDIDAEGMKYDGFRYRAEARLAGKLYGQRFGVDVAFGDPILDAAETVVARDVFGFAGIVPPAIRIYPIETHIAEKLHAYTLPRRRTNSRVRDLPDLALLGTIRSLEAARLCAAIAQTFAFRATHEPPKTLPEPPPAWRDTYAAMALEDSLPWSTLDVVFAAARTFVEPVLSDERCPPIWTSTSQRWQERDAP
ncbi:MAG: nucleotidyl transferase AbiEii/AbiGii toxin family protein [Deltaproteobacteria bacterium]|nr:nucleotidyl transferase AbiEii/AbiGii toxin family protein [Deltaproteobacteria bacterium]